jgi:DNA polymerase
MAAHDRLKHLRSRAETCTRCRLHDERTQLVFGTGNPEAALVLVGEAPGEHEDKSGEPFVGKAGGVLTSLLRRVGLSRDEVYILNVLKCRPPWNRDPKPDEVDACSPYLHLQLRIIQPRAIVALGKFAACTLLEEDPRDTPVGYLRKEDRLYDNQVTGFRCPVIVTYHPSWALRQLEGPAHEAKAALRTIKDDLARAAAIIGA